MKKVKKCIATLIDESGVVIKTQFMEGEDFFMSVDPEMCKILSKALEIKGKNEIPVVATKEEYYQYLKLKVRFMQENLLKFEGGSPIDWACFYITSFLNDYLEVHNITKTDTIAEKRIHTIAFAHALEDKLLDYIEKLEEFNND